MSDFYIGDLRSGQFLDLSIISQWRNIEIRSQNTLQKSIIISESCHNRPFLTIHIQFLIGDPSEGHLRSPRVTNGFLPITGDKKNIDLGMVSLSLSRRDALIHMQLDLLRSPHDTERSNVNFDLSRSSYTFFDAR